MTRRFLGDTRVQIGLAVGFSFLFVLAVIATQYGNTGIDEVQGVRRVQSDGEHCAIVLPEGWSWRPATWTAISPNGTEMGLSESLHGRPEYPRWEETVGEVLDRYQGRDDVTVTHSADTIRIDFGESGGLSVIQRFDRVGCRLTFSGSNAREQELPIWEEIIDSLVRTSPTGTPVEELPWKTS